ncbi:MAG TPA: alpha/beta hydrolase [Chitinophagaceae bacterium]|jgi:acetyl esterase/lipase|nr:alpha/beta hydrolase [Chitinophagaceae bacterium]
MKFLLLVIPFILGVMYTLPAQAQTIIPLYEGPVPNSKEAPDEETSEVNKDGMLIISKISRPTLTVYLPPREKRTGAGVIICPGGGYWVAAAGHEGADVARKFNEMGVVAFVLKYRIPSDKWMINREIGPLQDAQRALQLVRQRSKEWGIDEGKLGLMGFSAGGHLASTAGTHFKRSYIDNPSGVNLRPDFLILIYPVISFSDSVGHIGSREQLLGKTPAPEKVREYSNELQVTKETPPAFLVHAKDDGVKVENSLLFAAALQKAGVPYQVYLYEKGGHGYGMYNKTSDVLWMDLVGEWMRKLPAEKK